jgi:integrase
VDFAQALLVIPAEHYKCKHVHVVPLVPQAVEILENIYRGGKGDYILSTTDGERPIRGIAKYYEARLPRAIQVQTGTVILPFASHSLRRTVATRVAESLGIGGEPLIGRLLGHSQGSHVTAIYNRYTYLKEMRTALEAWARELTRGEREESRATPAINPGRGVGCLS